VISHRSGDQDKGGKRGTFGCQAVITAHRQQSPMPANSQSGAHQRLDLSSCVGSLPTAMTAINGPE